jgi:hypothetical protein
MEKQTNKIIINIVFLIIITISFFISIYLVDNNMKKDKIIYGRFCIENGGVQSNNMAIRYCIINRTIYRMDYSEDRLILFKEK